MTWEWQDISMQIQKSTNRGENRSLAPAAPSRETKLEELGVGSHTKEPGWCFTRNKFWLVSPFYSSGAKRQSPGVLLPKQPFPQGN